MFENVMFVLAKLRKVWKPKYIPFWICLAISEGVKTWSSFHVYYTGEVTSDKFMEGLSANFLIALPFMAVGLFGLWNGYINEKERGE